MAKSFRSFRNNWDDDEWGSDNDFRKKDKQLEKRRQERRRKVSNKNAIFDETIGDDE